MTHSKLFIETERLLIRPFTIKDLEPAYKMNLDEEVSKYTGDGGVATKKEIERRINEDVFGDYEKHGYGRLAVELKGENKFIGFAGLKYLEDLKEVDLGYRFMKKFWGQGIATEAGKACIHFGFSTLNLDRIIAMVLPNNAGSIRVLDKLHFKYEKDIIEDDLLAHIYSLNNIGNETN